MNIKNIEHIIDKFNKKHNYRYSYKEFVEYENNNSKISIICDKHGLFHQKIRIHLSGSGCQKCALYKTTEKQVKTTEWFIKRAEEKYKDTYDYSLVKYKGLNRKVSIKCKIHGIFEQSPNSHLYSGGCKKCANMNRRKCLEEWLTDFNDVHNNKYDYSLIKEINNNRDVIPVICKEHNSIFYPTPNNHVSKKSGCKSCSKRGISKGEEELYKYLKKLFPNRQILRNTRKIIQPHELDIFIPSLNLAFEYNGNYWHEEGINKPIGYHENKSEKCNKIGIRLIHIWESEWKENKNIII